LLGPAIDRRGSGAAQQQGNAAAAGFLDGGATALDFAVAKFSAADGQLLWQTTINAGFNVGFDAADQAFSVAVDAADDVIAGRYIAPVSLFVVKLNGVDGTEAWRSVSQGLNVSQLAIAPGGDVVAAGPGRLPSDLPSFDVLRLAGSTGDELCHVSIGPDATGYAMAVVVAPNGDAVAGGQVDDQLLVIWLASASGGELWRYQLTGQGSSRAEAYK
jgi:hypothetical protein